MDKTNRFGEFIANLRKEKGITQTELGEGLCTKSEMSRFERGERLPDKLLQNRFLTRLGVVPENYENFLHYKEYCRWEKRQGIIHHILDEAMEKAKELLELYFHEYNMNNPLEKQFYLAMLVQIRRYEKCNKAELANLFKEALELTVPGVEKHGFMNKILSLEEINLLLEYISCSESALNNYEALLKYIDKMERTQLAMAKIYPKTVFYYYLAWKHQAKKDPSVIVYMLELCNRAIELLRDANRLFYLWELFCMKEELADLLDVKARYVVADLEQCRRWKKALESIYRDADVSIAMYEFCYLYVESENYCIGDVIRIRRKMLGMSQEKLAQGICDPRRVSQMERNLARPQREVVQLLFDKLNLSMELNRTELVTDNPEAIQKYRELRVRINFGKCEEVSIMLNELRNMISVEIPSNRQIIRRKEINNQYALGHISNEEYLLQMRQTLECTIPYEKALKAGEKYLTNEEMYCIQNIAVETQEKDPAMKSYMDVLQEYCDNPKYSEKYIRMYQFLTLMLSSYLGNIGELDKSSMYEKRSVKLLVKNRRLGGLHEALYELAWIKKTMMEKEGEINIYEEMSKNISVCIEICELNRNKYKKQLYESKIAEICPKSGA